MRIDTYTKVVLTTFALLLAGIAFRHDTHPAPMLAEVSTSDIYMEPGIYMLRPPGAMRQQLGQVVVDLRTAIVWGFHTGSTDPYPGSTVSTMPRLYTYQLGKLNLKSLDL